MEDGEHRGGASHRWGRSMVLPKIFCVLLICGWKRSRFSEKVMMNEHIHHSQAKCKGGKLPLEKIPVGCKRKMILSELGKQILTVTIRPSQDARKRAVIAARRPRALMGRFDCRHKIKKPLVQLAPYFWRGFAKKNITKNLATLVGRRSRSRPRSACPDSGYAYFVRYASAS